VYDLFCILYTCYFIFLNSPFLFVCGDDRVIRYTGADVEIGGAEDVQPTEWGLALGLELGFFSLMYLLYFIMNMNFGNL